MEDYNYIEEISMCIEMLQKEIEDANDGVTRRMIARKCNNLELYTRALRDKLENG
jgi:hypothetical protein